MLCSANGCIVCTLQLYHHLIRAALYCTLKSTEWQNADMHGMMQANEILVLEQEHVPACTIMSNTNRTVIMQRETLRATKRECTHVGTSQWWYRSIPNNPHLTKDVPPCDKQQPGQEAQRNAQSAHMHTTLLLTPFIHFGNHSSLILALLLVLLPSCESTLNSIVQ